MEHGKSFMGWKQRLRKVFIGYKQTIKLNEFTYNRCERQKKYWIYDEIREMQKDFVSASLLTL